ncbi:MAG TPA: Ku protein, partial [Marmoricola sp.]|nr:Ku protein [Marmoricola sp.]
GEVVDLLAALQRSVDAAKRARGEAPAGEKATDAAEDEDGSSGTKKSAPKKSAAKKSAGTGKKKPARKSTRKAS